MNNIILTTPDELENLIQSSIRKVLSEQNIATHKVANEKFLTIKEAAEYLNLAEQTLYGFTSKGLIPFIKRAKRVLFLKADLEKWLKQGRKLTLQETKEKSIREGKICAK
jgi:excisionase family DNA binding protein